jgi:hypothetical protein
MFSTISELIERIFEFLGFGGCEAAAESQKASSESCKKLLKSMNN